jgi:hypothetical protein
MGGWHKILYPPLLDLAAGKQVERPTGKSLMLDLSSVLAGGRRQSVTSGTPNFRWMGAAWWYLWAIRYGAGTADRDDSRARVLELYRREIRLGHQLSEQTAPEPHDNFHRMAHAVIRLGAREAGDANVLAANTRWWAWRTALDAAGATPDGEVLLPGCRGDGGPTSQVGTAIYRMLVGLPHLGPAKSPKWWTDPAYGGGAPSLIRQLLARGDDLKAAADLPRLRLPMQIQRTAAGHFLTLTGALEDEPIIDWVRIRYGRPGLHDIAFGKDWKTSPEPL